MRMRLQCFLLSSLTLLAPAAQAAFGDVASNFGLLPEDIASSQALSMFSNHASVSYYNPAYLARDRAGSLTAGALYTRQDIQAQGSGTPDQVVSSSHVEDDPNYNIMLGMKTDLSRMLKDDRAMVLGFMLASERGGSQLVAFNSATSQTAQSLRFGQQSLFLNIGAGLRLARGLDVGIGSRITLAASANLRTDATLAGQTSHELLQVDAAPKVRPILSGNVNWGEVLCPNDKYCWAKGLETALAWRHETDFSTKVNATVQVPNTVSYLPLFIATLDSYQPETFSAGLQYNMYRLRYGLSADFQRWSRLNSILQRDTVRDQANLQFRDVLVPRAGFEYRFDNELSLLGGVSYERSPLKSTESLNVNFIDNDQFVLGLGMSYLIEKPILFALPLRMDVGYQYHLLKSRNFLLATDQNPNNTTSAGCQANTRCEYVTAKGNVHVVSAAVHFAF